MDGCTPLRPLSYLGFQGLDFEWKHLNIVVNTSRDHLLIEDLSRLSMGISGILSRKTAIPWSAAGAHAGAQA